MIEINFYTTKQDFYNSLFLFNHPEFIKRNIDHFPGSMCSLSFLTHTHTCTHTRAEMGKHETTVTLALSHSLGLSLTLLYSSPSEWRRGWVAPVLSGSSLELKAGEGMLVAFFAPAAGAVDAEYSQP